MTLIEPLSLWKPKKTTKKNFDKTWINQNRAERLRDTLQSTGREVK